MTASPFHRGEELVQTRIGVRDKIEKKGRAVIRTAMPEQHRQFFATLPFLVASTVDPHGQPWASMLCGVPGFVSSPDSGLLKIDAWPPIHDPITAGLRDGVALGALGIELPTRRRNRVNGHIDLSSTDRGFALRVDQSFGNCPKYIQARSVSFEPHSQSPTTPRFSDRLYDDSVALIAGADTFFIASRAAVFDGNPSHGLDVSHRGGLPGFVQILSEREIAFPDYKGNLLFNTLGNIVSDPRVGLLFVDFPCGTLLHVSGRARIVWDAAMPRGLQDVERLVFVEIEHIVLREGASPLKFEFLGYSPNPKRTEIVGKTGGWP
jgi:uncharacterized protein